MNHLCSEYLAHYHEERPHQGLDNDLLRKPKKRKRLKIDESVALAGVRCRQRLGGLLKSYLRAA